MNPATLTFYGRQADISWLHLSRKQDRHCRGRSVTDAFRHRPVAQEQSTRSITGRRRSITCRDDQPLLKLRFGRPAVACGYGPAGHFPE